MTFTPSFICKPYPFHCIILPQTAELYFFPLTPIIQKCAWPLLLERLHVAHRLICRCPVCTAAPCHRFPRHSPSNSPCWGACEYPRLVRLCVPGFLHLTRRPGHCRDLEGWSSCLLILGACHSRPTGPTLHFLILFCKAAKWKRRSEDKSGPFVPIRRWRFDLKGIILARGEKTSWGRRPFFLSVHLILSRLLATRCLHLPCIPCPASPPVRGEEPYIPQKLSCCF